MSNTKGTPLVTVLGLGLVFSAIAVGVSVHIGSKITKYMISESVDKAVTERLPAAVTEALAKIEADKISSQVADNLKPWANAHTASIDGRHIFGSPQAEFSLVEFSDLECGFCRRLHETPKTLVDQAGGKINWEWQHFPLQFHDPMATKGAEAAECVGEIAGNQAFWAFTGKWFEMSQMNGQGVEDITLLARLVGTEEKAFTECLASGKYKPLVEKQIEKGIKLGVTGTPATFVIDNHTGNRLLVKGAQPPQAFMEAIEQLVKMRTEAPSQESESKPAAAEAEAG